MNIDLTKPSMPKQEVLDLMNWKKSTLHNRIKRDGFPKSVDTGGRTRVWLTKEVLAYFATCVSKRAKEGDARDKA